MSAGCFQLGNQYVDCRSASAHPPLGFHPANSRPPANSSIPSKVGSLSSRLHKQQIQEERQKQEALTRGKLIQQQRESFRVMKDTSPMLGRGLVPGKRVCLSESDYQGMTTTTATVSTTASHSFGLAGYVSQSENGGKGKRGKRSECEQKQEEERVAANREALHRLQIAYQLSNQSGVGKKNDLGTEMKVVRNNEVACVNPLSIGVSLTPTKPSPSSSTTFATLQSTSKSNGISCDKSFSHGPSPTHVRDIHSPSPSPSPQPTPTKSPSTTTPTLKEGSGNAIFDALLQSLDGDNFEATKQEALSKKGLYEAKEQRDRLRVLQERQALQERREEARREMTELQVKCFWCANCKRYVEGGIAKEYCESNGHFLEVRFAMKRFFECRNCKMRKAFYDQMNPVAKCCCGERIWKLTSYYKEYEFKEQSLVITPQSSHILYGHDITSSTDLHVF